MAAGGGRAAQQDIARGRKIERPGAREQLRIVGGAHANAAQAVGPHGISGAGDLLRQGLPLRNTGSVAEHGERLKAAGRQLIERELGAPHVGGGAAGEFQTHAIIGSGENDSAEGGGDGDEQIVGIVGGFGARPDDGLGGEARVDFGAGAEGAVKREEAARVKRIGSRSGLRDRRINSR